jgi:hypothetical protein
MNADDVQELLDEIEENKGFVSAARVFNKPSLISISSADREPDAVNQTPYSQVAFSSFSVNLPRPALDVDSIQLVSSNLPQCNTNIPDTACVFWYYRLSNYSGVIPNSMNLFMNRLLPSYYKPEFINNASLFAFNKTFNNYAALSTELAKASVTDLAYYNWINVARPMLEGIRLDTITNSYIPFRPNDMLVSYNSTYNKFQGTGLSTTPASVAYNSGTTYALGAIVATPLVYAPYNSGTTYAIGNIVIVNYVLYRSLQNSNLNNPVFDTDFWKNIGDLCFWNRPQTWQSLQASNTNHTPASSPTWWKEIGVEYITAWDSDTTYNVGRYVTYGGVVYVSIAQNWNSTPSSSASWEVNTREFFYRYLITGPQDPNVIPAQAGVDPFFNDDFPELQWDKYGFYQVGDRVKYNGQLWRCVQQVTGSYPNPDPLAPPDKKRINNVPTQAPLFDPAIGYANFSIVRYRGVVYEALAVVPVGVAPTNTAYWEAVCLWGWDNVEWSSTITYYPNDYVLYNGVGFLLDPDIAAVSLPEWNNSTTYIANDVVSYQGVIYNARNSGTNQTPSSTSVFWIPQTSVSSNPPLSAWSVSTTYTQFQTVSYLGLMYVSTFSGNNTGSVPTTGVRWALRNYVDWTLGASYNTGRLVLYNNKLYQSLINSNTTPTSNATNWTNLGPIVAGSLNQPPPTIWSSATTYALGDYVLFQELRYYCIQSNANYQPNSNPIYWAFVDAKAIVPWNSGTAYEVNVNVIYNSIQYECVQSNTNRQPDLFTSSWVPVKTTQSVPEWESTESYVRGDLVFYNDVLYANIYASGTNINNQPDSSPTFWEPVPTSGWVLNNDIGAPAYGLYTTSTNFDFVEVDAEDIILIPFPIGLQAQAYTPVPKRLLNSIIGFTFNGIFNAEVFQDIDVPATGRVIQSQFSSQFNRVRAVPIYDVIDTAPPLLTLGAPAATASRVYTADGYCNLVYSSVISTYCDIVGASSVDTQRTTNLLAVNTMNCGNLGISFYAPFIDNPLTKMQNDIYTIFVEFRDEFGDLYNFTNNAVVTLTFKVTYKK